MVPGGPPKREHRRHPRLGVRHFKIQYRPGGLFSVLLAGKSRRPAILADCSEGGLRLLAWEPLERGVALSLRFEVPFMGEAFSVTGRVTRCRQGKDEKGRPFHEIGITLEAPGPDYLEMVRRLRQDPMLRQGGL